MSDVDDEQLGAEVERTLRNAMDNPMPGSLRDAVADEVEPHTINSYLKHDEVMTAIEIAYPLIRDYLREHGAEHE